MSATECLNLQHKVQHALAAAGVRVAALVAANYGEKIDYEKASSSTAALPAIVADIVKDGIQLSCTLNDDGRRVLLADLASLCGATSDLCGVAKTDRKKVNEAAMELANKSAILYYAVEADPDPTVEKEIISRVKMIGDLASRVATCAGDAGDAGDGGDGGDGGGAELCARGAGALNAAGVLLYTAKLVAPSIHEAQCQQVLVSSAQDLSRELVSFAQCCQQRNTPELRQLKSDVDNLDRIVSTLVSDVREGRLGRLREMEHLSIEDTPLRELTIRIIDDAKSMCEVSDISASSRAAYAAYADRLAAALRDLELAAARCRRYPTDIQKRKVLENAVNNLQMTLLTSRPNRTDTNSNIIDLRDYIDDVSAEAQKMAVAGEMHLHGHDKQTIQDVMSKCSKLSEKAYTLTHPDGETGYDHTFVDLLDVDTFAQDCEAVILQIEEELRTISDAKAKRQLGDKLKQLTETCHVLRFAAKSGISSSKSAGLFPALEDLDDIENRVVKNLLKDKESFGDVVLRGGRGGRGAGGGRLPPASSLVSAARDVTLSSPRAPLTAYIAHAAASLTSERDKNNLLKHVYKLVGLFRVKLLTSSVRLAHWTNIDHPEVAHITEQILQEIQSPESGFSIEGASCTILEASEVNRLLVPGEPKHYATSQEQEMQLSKLCTKLSSMADSVKSSVVSAEALARSARETARTARDLAAVARGSKDDKNPSRSNQLEEAIECMTFSTYNLLKVAEEASKDPTSHISRRRLQDACRNLNNAISKLVSPASPSLRHTCLALTLSLAGLSPPGGYSPPSHPYPPLHPSRDLSPDVSEELASPAPHTMSYENAAAALESQVYAFNKLDNDDRRCRLELTRELCDVTTAVRRSVDYATQCAYLMSISESHKEVACAGVADVPRVERCIELLQDSCVTLIGSLDMHQAKEETAELSQRLSDLALSLKEASGKAGAEARGTLTKVRETVDGQGKELQRALQGSDMDKVVSESCQMLEVLNDAYSSVEKCPLLPVAGKMSQETKARCDEVIGQSKSLVECTVALVKEVQLHQEKEHQDQHPETMTWTTFSGGRQRLRAAYEALLNTVKENGRKAGILKQPIIEEEKEETENKTYLEIQMELANRWLHRPMCKDHVRAAGHRALTNILDIAAKMSEDLSGGDREDLRHLVLETEELLLQCSASRDVDKYKVLADRVKELKKCVERGLVTAVVEDLLDVDQPLEDLETLVDSEPEPTKRKYILERKIAELLSQLVRVSRTARAVGYNTHNDEQLTAATNQAELLAPKLVQAAENRIQSPDDAEAIKKYKALVLEYSQAIGKVRELCDKSVDPMQFVQTAGDTMQRLREESANSTDPQKAAYASQVIIRLANRTIDVGLSSRGSETNPELQAELASARARLDDVAPSGTRASRLPDMQASTAEIIKATNAVESAMGGETIFNKQPAESDQQIFAVARSLHEAVRGWSSRDNDVVAAARRMAVLMANLSEHVQRDNKSALIATSKKIVLESQEVAELAKKLAYECTDVRIKNNLLQACERIPTVSGQLKMLTTVKASSLGHQGTEEDQAAMDMLVTNAQGLMMSIQEVVRGAGSASVKIMSQRGPRLKWVRKTYY